MKYIVFFVLIITVQYECKSNEAQILDLETSTSTSSLNSTTTQHSIDIDDCQTPSFANYTRGNRRFISVDDDTFKEYLKTVDLTLIDGFPEFGHFKNVTPPEDIINDFPVYLSGYDPENRPIFVAEVGKYPLVKYVLGGREMQALFIKVSQNLIYQYLKAMAFKSTKESPVHQYIQIVDLEGMKPETVLNFTVMKFFLKVVNLYRHWMHKYRYMAVYFNINPITEIGLNVVRSSTVFRRDWNKRIVYGTDRAFWVPKLVQMFGKYQLSEKYGGCKGFLSTYVA